MLLTTFISVKRTLLNSVVVLLLTAIAFSGNIVSADTLTYSPDQWPRRWNVLINQTQQPSDRYRQNNNAGQRPARSPMWGVVPSGKQKSRRSVRPEYNTQSHINHYPNQSIYSVNYYSGMYGNGLANPYVSPLLVPGVMSGFNSPGIPFVSNPYGVNPYLRGYPYRGYGW